MNNRQVTLTDLYSIIGSQTVEIEFLKSQIQRLQTMVEELKKSTGEAKNSAVPAAVIEESEQVPT